MSRLRRYPRCRSNAASIRSNLIHDLWTPPSVDQSLRPSSCSRLDRTPPAPPSDSMGGVRRGTIGTLLRSGSGDSGVETRFVSGNIKTSGPSSVFPWVGTVWA